MRQHRLQALIGLGKHHVVGGGRAYAREHRCETQRAGHLDQCNVARGKRHHARCNRPALLADDDAGAVYDRMPRGQHMSEVVDKEGGAVESLADGWRAGDVTRQRLRRFDLSRRLKWGEWHLSRSPARRNAIESPADRDTAGQPDNADKQFRARRRSRAQDRNQVMPPQTPTPPFNVVTQIACRQCLYIHRTQGWMKTRRTRRARERFEQKTVGRCIET